MRLNDKYVFPDLEPLNINILYEWSRICHQFPLCFYMLSFVTSLMLIIFAFFYYIVTFSHFFFSLTGSLLIPYAYVSIESIDYIVLSSFELNALLLISSVEILCLTL